MKKYTLIILITMISGQLFGQTDLETEIKKANAYVSDMDANAIKTVSSLSFFKHQRAYVFEDKEMEVRVLVEPNSSTTEAYFQDYKTNPLALNLIKGGDMSKAKGRNVDGEVAKSNFGANSFTYVQGELNPKLKLKYTQFFLIQFTNPEYTITNLVFHKGDMENEEFKNKVYKLASAVLFDKLETKLFDGIKNNSLEEVKFWIGRGADPNCVNEMGYPIIVTLLPQPGEETEPKLAILEYLLMNGADPNYSGKSQVTAMIPAASYGVIKTVELLIKYGADIEFVSDGKTPLDFAKNNDRKEMVAYLEKELAKYPTIVPKIKDNSKLTYSVDFFGKKYKFIMDVLQTEPQATFQWKMTLEGRDDKAGTITIKEEALTNGYKLYNLFDNGEIVLDDVTTCVWVSKRVFEDMPKTDYINNLQTGPGDETNKNYTFTKKEKLVLANGKKVMTQLWTDEDDSNRIWVLDDINNRLIMKMDLGWTIQIDSIEE